jgi:hypothetical protein
LERPTHVHVVRVCGQVRADVTSGRVVGISADSPVRFSIDSIYALQSNAHKLANSWKLADVSRVQLLLSVYSVLARLPLNVLVE